MPVYVEAAGCTNMCRHCGAGGRPPYGAFYSLDELRELRETWGPLVIYHEASAHPDYPEIMSPDIWPVEGVHSTNGFGLARADDAGALFGRLREFGWDSLSLSLHGTGENHDWFVRRKGAYDDILCATDRAIEAGFGIHWNIFLDGRNLEDVPALVDLRRERGGASVFMALPGHKVSDRLWRYEELRPSLRDVQERLPAELVDELWREDPEELTEDSWLKAWAEAAHLEKFRHQFEPIEWSASEDLMIVITRDRTVDLDPYHAPRIQLGRVAEGRDALLQRLEQLPKPPTYERPPPEAQAFEGSDLLHAHGWSLRYKTISQIVHSGRPSGE